MSVYRQYAPDELGPDGYPPVWHERLKHEIRRSANHRCLRCLHPYLSGEHGNGEWSPCDAYCRHFDDAPIRVLEHGEFMGWYQAYNGGLEIARAGWVGMPGVVIQAQWRILTVHHLDGDKANCRWWNLVALCQRCHLEIQGRVKMEQVWPWEHSDWFKPYAAAYYAHTYLGEEIGYGEAIARMDELLALERVA